MCFSTQGSGDPLQSDKVHVHVLVCVHSKKVSKNSELEDVVQSECTVKSPLVHYIIYHKQFPSLPVNEI